MKIHRFFVDQQLPSHGKVKIQDEALVHQLRNVLRYKAGDKIVLFDTTGAEFEATVSSLGSKSDKGTEKIEEVEITASRPKNFAPRVPLFIFLSLPKRDAFEWIIEKGTELGVTGFVPVVSERSEKKEINMERTRKIATEACEQSGRSVRPTIYEPTDFEETLENLSGISFALDPRGMTFDDTVVPRASSDGLDAEHVNVFVGPEGGFSESELRLFKEKNIPVYSLGAQVLRVETAVVAIATHLLLFS